MLIDPVSSEELVKSVQRDYRRAAEEHRLMKQVEVNHKGIPSSVKVGLALGGIISLLVAFGQFKFGKVNGNITRPGGMENLFPYHTLLKAVRVGSFVPF